MRVNISRGFECTVPEPINLRMSALNHERNTITIDHTAVVAQVDGVKTLVLKDTGKTKSSIQTLPPVPQFREMLLSLRTEQEENRRLCGRSYNQKQGKYVYVSVLGDLIRPDYLTAEFPKWMEKNGFRRLRFHDLRHSCASLLLANGVPLKLIQEWLGHSSFKITADAYAHLDYEAKISAANAMTWVNQTSLGNAITV